MPNIEATITLKDNASSAVSSIQRSLGKLTSILESINLKLDKFIDPAAFNASKNAINGVNTSLVNVNTNLNRVVVTGEEVATTFQLTQEQIHKIEKLTDEIALSEDRRLKLNREIAKLREAEEVDYHAIKTKELQIQNLLSGEQLKRDAIFKQIDDAAKASGKITNELVRQQIYNDRLAASSARRAAVELAAENRIDQLSEDNALKDLKREEQLTTVVMQQEALRVKAKLGVAKAEEQVRTQEEKTNNEKLKGIKLNLSISKTLNDSWEKLKRECVAYAQKVAYAEKDNALAAQYESTLNQANAELQKSEQLLNQMTTSADRTNRVELKQLGYMGKIVTERKNIVSAIERQFSNQSKLLKLEKQGITTGFEVSRLKKQIARDNRNIANSQSKILSLEKQIKVATEQAANAQNKHNESVKRTSSSANFLWSKIKQIGGMYMGTQAVGGVIKTSDQLAANEARLALMVKEGETVDQLSDKIYSAAMRSRASYFDMADAVSKVGIQAGNLFDNNDQMVRFMETFSKMAVISKSTTQQTNAAMTQLIQSLSFGQLRGDELKSILENMPMVAQVIADEMTRAGVAAEDLPEKLRHIADDGKVTADEIRALGYEGQISAETVVNAMLNGSKKIDKMAKGMTWTWGQVWTAFKNAALRAFTPVLKGINKLIETDRFKRFVTWCDTAMNRISAAITRIWDVAAPVLAAIFDAIARIGQFFGENWSFIAPIIWGVVGALTAMKVATMLSAIWSGILTGTKIVGTFFTWAFTKATLAQAGAQWGLNSAMYACPLVWIIGLIVAIIVLIYLVVAAYNKWTNSAISATGIICGCFMAIWAFAWNCVANIWNAVAMLIEYFVNVWQHPVYAVKNAMANMAYIVLDSFIAMMSGCDEFANKFTDAIVGAINNVLGAWNKFVDVMPSVVTSALGLEKADMVSSKGNSSVSALKEVRSKIENLVGDTPADYWKAPKMEYKEVLGNYMKGYEFGEGLSNTFDDMLDPNKLMDNLNLGQSGDFSKALNNAFDPAPEVAGKTPSTKNPALDKIKDDTGKIADGVGSAANSLDKASEDTKYLRELAEREAINKYTLTDLNVNMTNHNTMNSDVDVDNFGRRLWGALVKNARRTVPVSY